MQCNRYLGNIVWELTLRCNACCAHCGSAAGTDRKDNLTNAKLMRVCDELAELGCRKVTLIGGEAFLHPAWREIVKKLRSQNIDVAIVTNAFAVNEEKIKFLAENQLEVLGISLDGARAETHDGIRHVCGMFDHIFSLSEYMEKYNLPSTAITTITKRNILELPEIMKMLPQTFFDCWQLQVGVPFGRLDCENALTDLEYYVAGIFVALMQRRYRGHYPVFGMHCFGYYSKVIPDSVNIYETNWHGCPGGHLVMGIRSNGKVTACLSIYDDKYLEGDLRKNSLKEIWENKNFCSWNKSFNKYKRLKGFCKTCEYALACCAGCSSSAASQTEDGFSAPWCYHKTESEYENYQGDDVRGKLLCELVNGSITEDGYFRFKNGEILNEDSQYTVNDEYCQRLLNILK